MGNALRNVYRSQGFQQAKSGLLKSGVLEHAGNVAGQALNTLTDIGRLKMEQELTKLREKALGPQDTGITNEQLAQLLATMTAPAPPATVEVSPAPLGPLAPTAGEALGPLLPPAGRPVAVPGGPRRKRKRVSGWGAALNDMLGDGVGHGTAKYCY